MVQALDLSLSWHASPLLTTEDREMVKQNIWLFIQVKFLFSSVERDKNLPDGATFTNNLPINKNKKGLHGPSNVD